MSERKLLILVVDDDPDDVELTRQMLLHGSVPVELRHARHGEDALELLRRPGAPRPDLVLLDLNMPIMDGRTFLMHVKTDPGLKDIPVVVFTTSDAPSDAAASRALGADGFLSKPMGLAQADPLQKTIAEHWRAVRGS